MTVVSSRERSEPSESVQPSLTGGREHRGLGPMREAQLAQERCHVVLHRLLSEVHPFSDLPVRLRTGDQSQDLTFAEAERRDPGIRLSVLAGLAPLLLGAIERAGAGGEAGGTGQRSSRGDGAHRAGDVGRADGLQKEPIRPRGSRGALPACIVVPGEYQAPASRVLAANGAAQLDAAAVGQVHVEHGDVGSGRRDPAEGFSTAPRLTDHAEIGRRIDDGGNGAPYHLVIVDQEDPGHLRTSDVVGPYPADPAPANVEPQGAAPRDLRPS